MRAFGLSAVPLVFVMSLSGCASAVRQEPQEDLAENVILSASCAGITNTFSADPWQAKTRKGRMVTWTVDPNSEVREFAIGPVDDWPFLPGNPLRPARGNPARSPAVKPTAKRHNLYTVAYVCPNDRRRVIVDPDIIVVDGS